MKKTLIRIIAAASCTLVAISTQAADYPSKPIQLVVPAGAGTTTDMMARLYAAYLADEIKGIVVVENKPGASGNIAHKYVADSERDGYTLVLGNTGPLAINPTLYNNIPFDPIKDFVPVAMLGFTPTLLVVRADAPWDSVQDLVAEGQQNPGKLTFASAGNGTTGHLAAELLKIRSKTDMLHVPYKQGSQAMTDVVSGEVDFIFYHPAVVVPLIKAGKLKALGVSSKARSEIAPDVLPLAESGFPDFDLTGWLSVNAPRGISSEVLSKLIDASNKVLAKQEYVTRLRGMGMTPLEIRGEALDRYMETELEKWSEIVKLSGARVD